MSVTEIFASVASLVAIVMSLVGTIIALFKFPADRARQNSDAASAVAQSVTTLLEPLRERVECLEAENEDFRRRIIKMEEEIKRLKTEHATEMNKLKAEHEFEIRKYIEQLSLLNKERDAILEGAKRLVFQIQSISSNIIPVYMPPEK